MKKRVLALMMLFLLIGLFGCAKTQVTDVFRFEVRELEMTLYADETKNLEKELGLIKGDIDKDAPIVYTMSYVEGKNAGETCFYNDILEIISVEDYVDEGGIVAGTIIASDKQKVKVKAIGEGTIRLTAFLKDSPNVTDSIIVTVTKETLNGLKINVPDNTKFLYFGQSIQLEVQTFPAHIESEFLYKSDNPLFATVDKNGLVTGVRPSEGSTETTKDVTITVTSKYDPTVYAKYKFTVRYESPKSITVKNGSDVIEKDEVVALTRGDELQITTSVGSEKGFANQKVTFKSSDANVATISNTGLIKAVNGGEATITVTTSDGTVNTSFKVSVGYTQSTALELKLNNEAVTEATINVILDKKYDFTATVSPVESANQGVKIEVAEDYKNFVKVNGLTITPLKVGDFKLKVITLDEENPIEIELSFKADYDVVTSVEIKPVIKPLVVGDEYQLVSAVLPSGARQDVEYLSSDATVATVDETGLVKALKIGDVTITVKSKEDEDKFATITLTVYSKPTSFEVTGAKDSIAVDEELVLTVVLTPGSSYATITSVNDENDCCDISIDGLTITLTGYEVGTTTITISIEGLPDKVINLEVVE